MRFLAPCVTFFCCLVSIPVQAQFTEVFSESFDEGNIDRFVEADIIGQILTGVTGTPTSFHDVSYPDGAVRLTSPPTPNPEFGPARTGIEQQSVSVTNFDVSVDVVGRGDHLSNGFCLSARTSELGPGTTNGYLFCGVNVDGGIGFAINAMEDEEFLLPQVARTTEETTAAIATDEGFRMNFRGVGNLLQATVHSLNDPSTPLVVLRGRDDRYASGFTGIAVGAGGQGPGLFDLESFGDATFDNYTVAVPEPRGLTIGLLSVLLLAGRRRRRNPQVAT